jgi:hypothetical protein
VALVVPEEVACRACCQDGVGQVGCGPSASFQCGWIMKQGRSSVVSCCPVWADAVLLAKAPVAVIATVPTMAPMRRMVVVVMGVLSSDRCGVDAGVG